MLTAQSVYHRITSGYSSMEEAEKWVKQQLQDFRDSILTEAKQVVENLEEGYYDTFYAGKEAAVTAITNLRDGVTS